MCVALALNACGGSSGDSSPTTETKVDSEPTTTMVMSTEPEVVATEAPAISVPTNSDLPKLGDCPTAVFPDLSSVAGAGPQYAMPKLSMSCTDDEIVVLANGMPGYTFEPKTPNSLGEQAWEWHVPLRPEVADKTTTIVDVLGTLGFTTTGLPIYGPTEGPVPEDSKYGDPAYNGLLDTCGGHAGPTSSYHQHTLNPITYCNLDYSYIIGYALDGFPIYNSVGCVDLDCKERAEFVSGYDMTGDPKTYSWKAYTYNATGKTNVLDECNGRIGPDGTYRYHATKTFPYIIGCYRGTQMKQIGAAAADMSPMGPPQQANTGGSGPPPNNGGSGPPPNGSGPPPSNAGSAAPSSDGSSAAPPTIAGGSPPPTIAGGSPPPTMAGGGPPPSTPPPNNG